MSKNFGQRPSDFFGIVDRGIAADFDQACSLRLLLFDCEVKQAEAEALASHADYGASAPLTRPPDVSQYN